MDSIALDLELYTNLDSITSPINLNAELQAPIVREIDPVVDLIPDPNPINNLINSPLPTVPDPIGNLISSLPVDPKSTDTQSPSVTIYIVGRGTLATDGSRSTAGHMWYSITDSNGTVSSYGFSPINGTPIGAGDTNIHGSDSNYYLGDKYSRTIGITQSQYDDIKKFGDKPAAGGFSLYYNALTNSCVDFVWKGLEKIGLNPTGFEGKVLPTDNIGRIEDLVNPTPPSIVIDTVPIPEISAPDVLPLPAPIPEISAPDVLLPVKIPEISASDILVPAPIPEISLPYDPSYPEIVVPDILVPTYMPDYSTTDIPAYTPDYSTIDVPTYMPDYSTTDIPAYTPDYSTIDVPTYVPDYSTTDIPAYTPDYWTIDVSSYTPDYSTTYTPSYTPDYSTTYTSSYTPDYSTTYTPSYTPDYSTTYTPSYTPDYSTTYTPSYTPDYSPSFDPGFFDPVVLDLTGDGFNLLDAETSSAHFDILGGGKQYQTGWAGASNGLLAYDVDNDSLINHRSEIAFIDYKPGAKTDLEGLTAFDTNQNGWFEKSDDKWNQFGVWEDKNVDGVTDQGEYHSLNSLGIQSIYLTSDHQKSVMNGNIIHGVTQVVLQNGSSLLAADVSFNVSSQVLI